MTRVRVYSVEMLLVGKRLLPKKRISRLTICALRAILELNSIPRKASSLKKIKLAIKKSLSKKKRARLKR